ncbi:MAG TPA: sigma-70 family RNA polymerase sigma factor [Gaiellaceae bacterium]
MQGAIRTGRAWDRKLADRSSARDDPATLLRLYKSTGDSSARQQLIELHLPLVRALARRYAHCGEGLEDLVQVGSIGLIEAVDRFDPERGTDLASFAVPTITGEIKKHLRDRSTVVRIPRRLAELSALLRVRREVLAARLSRPPTVSELAQELGVGEDDVVEAMETERVRVPLGLSTADAEDRRLEAAIAVDDALDSTEERLLLAAGFRTLAERERRILHLRFFGGLSQTEIAREVGLSQIQVSRLIRDSLERLRGALDRRSAEQGRSLVRL